MRGVTVGALQSCEPGSAGQVVTKKVEFLCNNLSRGPRLTALQGTDPNPSHMSFH